MSLIWIVSVLLARPYSRGQRQDVPLLAPVNMDSVTVIESFDHGEVLLECFPGEDADPASFELTTDSTYEGSPFSLKLFGNTRKVEGIDSMTIEAGDVWQVSAFIDSVGEIQGFGVMDGTNVLFYALLGLPWVLSGRSRGKYVPMNRATVNHRKEPPTAAVRTNGWIPAFARMTAGDGVSTRFPVRVIPAP